MRGSSHVYPGALFVVFLDPLKLFRFRSICIFTPRVLFRSSSAEIYPVGLTLACEDGNSIFVMFQVYESLRVKVVFHCARNISIQSTCIK